MLTALLTTENLDQRIAAHNPERYSFQYWMNGENIHFDVVSDDMEPNRQKFWGYCAQTDSYFISDSVDEIFRIPILQMAHYQRTGKNISHLEAAIFVLKPEHGGMIDQLSLVLYLFYREEASSFESSGQPLDRHARDIIETREYFRTH